MMSFEDTGLRMGPNSIGVVVVNVVAIVVLEVVLLLVVDAVFVVVVVSADTQKKEKIINAEVVSWSRSRSRFRGRGSRSVAVGFFGSRFRGPRSSSRS